MKKRLFNLLIAGFVAIASAGIANALEETQDSNATYLNNHGHSAELIRLVDVQKNRINNNEVKVVKDKHPRKSFFKKLMKWDFTDYEKPFGDRKIN